MVDEGWPRLAREAAAIVSCRACAQPPSVAGLLRDWRGPGTLSISGAGDCSSHASKAGWRSFVGGRRPHSAHKLGVNRQRTLKPKRFRPNATKRRHACQVLLLRFQWVGHESAQRNGCEEQETALVAGEGLEDRLKEVMGDAYRAAEARRWAMEELAAAMAAKRQATMTAARAVQLAPHADREEPETETKAEKDRASRKEAEAIRVANGGAPAQQRTYSAPVPCRPQPPVAVSLPLRGIVWWW